MRPRTRFGFGLGSLPHHQVAFVVGGGGGVLSAIVLSFAVDHVAGTNPPEWDSDFTSYLSWDSVALTGDKHLMRWRRVNGGAWTTEAEQPLDDELIMGGFTWPLYEAAKPLFGGYFEVQEQRARYTAGVEVARSAWSNSVVDNLSGALPGASTTNFHLFGGDCRFIQYNGYVRNLATAVEETV
jgi:hypothetical protein